MRPYQLLLALVAFVLIALATVACGFVYPDCRVPDDPQLIPIETGDYRLSHADWGPLVKGSDGPVYIRVTSESLIEVVYERDSQVVVETYEMSERSRELRSF